MTGEVRGLNPYRGSIPVMCQEQETWESLANRSCYQSVAELEHVLARQTGGSELHIPFPQDLHLKLSRSFGFQTQVSLFVQTTEIVKIIDAARTVVLNWALRLEKDGILGEGAL